jgi:hypothetical protein
MQAEPFTAEHASNAIASIYIMCHSLNCRANANAEPYAHLRSGETLSVLVGQSACRVAALAANNSENSEERSDYALR